MDMGFFGMAAATGVVPYFHRLLRVYYDNMPFRWKLFLLLLAGINMIAFRWITNTQGGALGKGDEVHQRLGRRRINPPLGCGCRVRTLDWFRFLTI